MIRELKFKVIVSHNIKVCLNVFFITPKQQIKNTTNQLYFESMFTFWIQESYIIINTHYCYVLWRCEKAHTYN